MAESAREDYSMLSARPTFTHRLSARRHPKPTSRSPRSSTSGHKRPPRDIRRNGLAAPKRSPRSFGVRKGTPTFSISINYCHDLLSQSCSNNGPGGNEATRFFAPNIRIMVLEADLDDQNLYAPDSDDDCYSDMDAENDALFAIPSKTRVTNCSCKVAAPCLAVGPNEDEGDENDDDNQSDSRSVAKSSSKWAGQSLDLGGMPNPEAYDLEQQTLGAVPGVMDSGTIANVCSGAPFPGSILDHGLEVPRPDHQIPGTGHGPDSLGGLDDAGYCETLTFDSLHDEGEHSNLLRMEGMS